MFSDRNFEEYLKRLETFFQHLAETDYQLFDQVAFFVKTCHLIWAHCIR